jgi:hypothetical protein
MVPNKPSYKTLLIIVSVSVFILVLGVVGIIYHFNNSQTEIGNGKEKLNRENETSEPLEIGGELPKSKGNDSGEETPKSKGISTGGSLGDENLAAKLAAEKDPKFIAAKDIFSKFLQRTNTPKASPLLPLASDGSNEVILKFYEEYLEIKKYKDSLELKDTIDPLDIYFKAVLETTKADSSSFYMKLRKDLASFCLETIKAHKAIIAFGARIAAEPESSPNLDVLISTFNDLLTFGFPNQPFTVVFKEFASSLKILKPIIDEVFIPIMETVLRVHQLRLEFTPLIDHRLVDKTDIYKNTIRACTTYSNLIPLLLLPESLSVHLQEAQKAFFKFQIWEDDSTNKFIRECFEDESKAKELTLLKNFYFSDTPYNSSSFVCISKEYDIVNDNTFPSEVKIEFLDYIRNFTTLCYKDFFQLYKSFVRKPAVANLSEIQFSKLFSFLDTYIKAFPFPSKPRMLRGLLELVKILKTPSVIEKFINHLDKLDQLRWPIDLVEEIGLMCKEISNDVSQEELYILLIKLGKAYKSDRHSIGDAFLDYWHIPKLRQVLSDSDIGKIEGKFPDQVKNELKDKNKFEEYVQILTAAKFGPITSESDIYKYIVVKLGIKEFKNPSHYERSSTLDEWIEQPLNFKLIENFNLDRTTVETLLKKRGLSLELTDFHQGKLIDFLLEIGPKCDIVLLEALINYLAAVFAKEKAGKNFYITLEDFKRDSNKITDLKKLLDLFTVAFLLEKAKDSSGQFDAKTLDMINDNYRSYLVAHVLEIASKKPTGNLTTNPAILALPKPLGDERDSRRDQKIIEAAAPYFDSKEFFKYYTF